MTHSVAAVDLGATSGRVTVGHVGPNELRLKAVARLPNGGAMTPQCNGAIDDGLRWNASGLFEHVAGALREAAAREPGIASIGVDSWAVDYALLNGDRMLGEPYHYRDKRTSAGVKYVHAFALAIVRASELAHKYVSTVHIVGGGSLNELLCQRTADRLGQTVIAGPVEASTIGNALVQARALGAVSDTLEGMRDLVRTTFSVRQYTPKEQLR